MLNFVCVMQEELHSSGSADTTPGADLSWQQMGRGTGWVKCRAANSRDPMRPDIPKFRVEQTPPVCYWELCPSSPTGWMSQPCGLSVPKCSFYPFIYLGSMERLCQGRTNPSWAPWKGPAGQGCLCLHLALPPFFYSGSREAAEPCCEREADGARIQGGCAAHLFGTKMKDTRWNSPEHAAG